MHGNYTHFILPYTAAEAREKFKDSLPGTPFRYDPMPTLRAVKAPQLWILGEDDLEAPSAETSSRIKTLIAQGKPITLAAISSRRTRNDRVRNCSKWRTCLDPIRARLFRHDA